MSGGRSTVSVPALSSPGLAIVSRAMRDKFGEDAIRRAGRLDPNEVIVLPDQICGCCELHDDDAAACTVCGHSTTEAAE